MDNPSDSLRAALRQAREVHSALEYHAERLVEFLNEPGVLQQCSAYELRRLKTALREFNMISGRWRKKR